MSEDSSFIFHRSISATVYLARRNGLFYLPICAASTSQSPLITAGIARVGENRSHTDNDSEMNVSPTGDAEGSYPALKTFDKSLLGFLHDANGESVQIDHGARTASNFAGSVTVLNATVPSVSVKISPEQISGNDI